jgi:5-methyltetrahydrofolate--homocysteine methyltransferase
VPIDFSADRWNTVRRNADLWWAGELRRPLLQVAVEGRQAGRDEPPLPSRDFLAQYDDSVSADEIVDRLDWELSRLTFLADGFPHVFVNFGAGVLAAMIGAKLEARPETVWFSPPAVRDIRDIHFAFDPANRWLARVKDVCQAAVARWKGLVQVSMTDLGGTLDVLSTFRPGEALLLDLYDHPADVERLTWELHDLWFRCFDEIDAVLRRGNPGYSAWPGFFCSKRHYVLQCDFAYMLSPDMFGRFVRPELVAACGRLDCPFYHLDGAGQLAHLDALLSIDELRGVQWVPGAGAPDCRHWPDVYRRIRRAGKLVQIWLGEDLDWLDVIADQLGGAEGIVVVGRVPADREGQLRDLLARHGAG